MPNNRSTRIIAIGVAVFVVGGALLFLVLHNGKSSTKATAQTAPTTTTSVPGSLTYPLTTTPSTVLAFKIPAGQNAVDVPMEYFAGVGGYVRSGDQINVFSTYNSDCKPGETPATAAGLALVLSNVKVLSVLGGPPAATGTASSYLLALTPQDAAKVIFDAKFQSLYFTLTTDNEPAVAPFGVNCTSAL